MTTVNHITPRIKPNQIYCGRAGKNQSGKWGNPEKLLSERDRLSNIERFHHRLFQGDLQSRLRFLEELKNKELVCFCFPKACHCNVYADIVNQIWS